MIPVVRPPAGPVWLGKNRNKRLPALRQLIALTPAAFDPKTIGGYSVAKERLFHAQHHKCCYCERKPFEKHQAVEHYRPKSRYWWLSWDWSNLLFCCQRCNEYKGDRFPLVGGTPLIAESAPPGTERPAILDAADLADAADPLDHIIFRPKPRWMPFPRDGSRRGYETIRTCKLDASDLLDAYRDHAGMIRDTILRLQRAVGGRNTLFIQAEWEDVASQWLSPSRQFTALSRDILDHHFPLTTRRHYGLTLELRPPLA